MPYNGLPCFPAGTNLHGYNLVVISSRHIFSRAITMVLNKFFKFNLCCCKILKLKIY